MAALQKFASLQVRRVSENRIAKSVCFWFAESTNSRSIIGNGRINNGIHLENSRRDGTDGEGRPGN